MKHRKKGNEYFFFLPNIFLIVTNNRSSNLYCPLESHKPRCYGVYCFIKQWEARPGSRHKWWHWHLMPASGPGPRVSPASRHWLTTNPSARAGPGPASRVQSPATRGHGDTQPAEGVGQEVCMQIWYFFSLPLCRILEIAFCLRWFPP